MWRVTKEADGSVHVIPLHDTGHMADRACPCGPQVERIDPSTGRPYPGGAALITHRVKLPATC